VKLELIPLRNQEVCSKTSTSRDV